MIFNAQEHWNSIYQSKKTHRVSWYQETPQTSLSLIAETSLAKDAKIIDVGAGDSTLVDHLLAQGFRNITVLDVSSTALDKAKKRLGDKVNGVQWIVSDIRKFKTNDRYGLWHDRAVLHFLTKEQEAQDYAKAAWQFLVPGGYLIISAFSFQGPTRCSGLEVKHFSEDSMRKLFCEFEHLKSFEEEHLTPWGVPQMFIHNLFRKRGD
ncbi:MAG: class I SAM-dependent methyltransferase [Nanoarchaeota archaeon]